MAIRESTFRAVGITSWMLMAKLSQQAISTRCPMRKRRSPRLPNYAQEHAAEGASGLEIWQGSAILCRKARLKELSWG